MPVKETSKNTSLIEEMRQAGAHFGYSKSRRHPSTGKYVYGTKNKTEFFDLTLTASALEKAGDYVAELKEAGKTILFVGTKNEAKKIVKDAAIKVDEPYVTNRWIGGTLTNWGNIKKRVDKLKDMKEKRESGEFSKYTKKEQLLLSREIGKLEESFGGIINMNKMPDALFVVDPRHEEIAVKEAADMNIPVIALANTDCNIADVDVAIPGNDATVKSINFFVDKVLEAYKSR